MGCTLFGKCLQCDLEYVIGEYNAELGDVFEVASADSCPDCGSEDIVTWNE